MKTTNFFVILALIASSFVYTSCDTKKVVEDDTAVNVPVPDFSVNIQTTVEVTTPEPEEVEELRSENLLNYFEGEATLDINEKDFKNLKNNKELILWHTLKIGAVNVLVDCSTGDYAENVSFSVAGVGSLNIQKCVFGVTYTSTELSTFAAKIFVEFVKRGLITVHAEGYTDAEAGGDITISLSFKGVEVKAKIVQF